MQDELAALFGKVEDDHAARVKCDFRETLSDVMVEQTIPAWVQWAHDNTGPMENSPQHLAKLRFALPLRDVDDLFRDGSFGLFAALAQAEGNRKRAEAPRKGMDF